MTTRRYQLADDVCKGASMVHIHCAFSSDNNYIQHLAVAITSLLENNRQHSFVLHLVQNDVSPTALADLSKHVATYSNATLHVYNFDDRPYRHFRLDAHITLASYFRLFLTEILPSHVERVIYLDADIVVLDDIAPLWRLAPADWLIAAAPNVFSENNDRLGLPTAYRYFNAGILVINLVGWRSEGLLPRFVEYVERNHAILRWHDQDALNAVLHDRVKPLEYTWNFQARTKVEHAPAIGLSPAGFHELRRKPKIVHFTTDRKPWFFAHNVTYEAEYLKYLRLTPWRSYKPHDKTLKGWVQRYFPRSRHHYWEIKRLLLRRLGRV